MSTDAQNKENAAPTTTATETDSSAAAAAAPTKPDVVAAASSDEGADEGSPLVIGLVVLGLIAVVIIVAVALSQQSGPPIEEVRGTLYRAFDDIDGVDSAQRISSNIIGFNYNGKAHTLEVRRMHVEDGVGRLVVEVRPEGGETFHANVFAEPTGEEEEPWRLKLNENGQGIDRLWTRIARRQTDGSTADANGYIDDPDTSAASSPSSDPNNPIVSITTSMGDIELELFEHHYPNSVANFITLAEQGFYEGTKFHRIIDGFMIQGGDPNTRTRLVPGQAGTGGPGYRIPDERDEHTVFDRAGLLAYANSGPNTSGSQFFITLGATPHLNHGYNLFGRVVGGMETVRAIGKIPVSPSASNPREISWPDQIVEVLAVEVIRKRDHDYTVRKVGER